MSNELQQKPLSNMELSAFFEQMSLVLKSGISAAEGLGILLEEAKEPKEKALLSAMSDKLMETASLTEALTASGVFPDYALHMVRIGEETGSLDEVTEALGHHYEREENISRSIKSAVTYPLIMAGMMIVVILILLIKVMPIFSQVYAQLGSELSGVSLFLMNLGTAISRYAIPIVIILIAIVVLILLMTHTDGGRRILRKLAYKTGISRKMYEEIAASRFADGMSLTLKSGFDSSSGLDLVTELNDDPEFAKKLAACRNLQNEGAELGESLTKSGIFSGVYARMASVASKTGSLDQVMSRIANLYQDDIDNTLNGRLARLEPTLVIVLSLIVGVILLSVMLPLMGVMSGL